MGPVSPFPPSGDTGGLLLSAECGGGGGFASVVAGLAGCEVPGAGPGTGLVGLS